MNSTKVCNGYDKLNAAQIKRFDELQQEFRDIDLWVGFKDDDPETADELTVQDDHPDWDDSTDDNGDLLQFVLTGLGDLEDLAYEYAEQLREE